MPPVTCLDVLDTFFDGDEDAVQKVSQDEVHELHLRLAEFYAAWCAPDPDEGEVRLYFDTELQRAAIPGQVAPASISYSSIDLAALRDDAVGAVASMRRKYTAGLLYADRVVAVDPVSRWTYTSAFFGNPRGLVDAWNGLKRIEPLVRHGCLLLAPIAPPDAAIPPNASQWERELSEAMGIAGRTYATLPNWPYERVAQLALNQASNLDVLVAEALAAVDLPMLSGLPVDTFLKIRESEDAFTAWRADLRLTGRMLGEITDRRTFVEDAQTLFEDVLVPRADAVRRSFSRSAALRTAIREQPIRTSLGALAVGLVAAGTGAPPDAAIASATAAGVAQFLAAVLLRPKPTGSAAVLANLV
jgi:hypothetical protein